MEESKMEKWNPLELVTMSSDDDYKQLAIHSTKQQIRNILKSYVGYYDPFCELLQNAMDAVDNRREILHERDYKKRINIVINLQENSIYVADNGIGFTETQFKTFLSPNITFKDQGITRGNKGVGTTYLAYGFNKTEIYTKTPEYEKYAYIEGGRSWIDDSTNSRGMPFVISLQEQDKEFPYDRGSSFKLFLTSTEGNKVHDYSWLGIDTAKSWEYVLLTNTPLGYLSYDDKGYDVFFDLTVISKDGHCDNLNDQRAEFFYPHKFLKSHSQNIDEVIQWQSKMIQQGKDASNILQKFQKKSIIYKFYNIDDLIELMRRSKTYSETEMKLVQDYSVWAYGCFCNSVDRWTDINEKNIGVRKNVNVVTYGLQMATDHMVQGSSLQIPLTSHIGYQKQCQIIVHFSGAEPDLGRKGFQPELRGVAEKLSSTIVSLGLSGWRKLLAADASHDNRDSSTKELHDYIRDMEEHEKESPLAINDKETFLPTRELSISSTPQSEQDVVVLFNQLIAGGVIRSIELMASSTFQRYDGLYKINIKPPVENQYYDKRTNPLGIEPGGRAIEEGVLTEPKFLEYKINFDSLIQDFDNEDKDPRDLGLVVVWNMGNRWKERFQVYSYLLPNYRFKRPYQGFTHEVYDSNTNTLEFYCIVLEELVDYLNDEEGYLKKYKGVYSEDD